MAATYSSAAVSPAVVPTKQLRQEQHNQQIKDQQQNDHRQQQQQQQQQPPRQPESANDTPATTSSNGPQGDAQALADGQGGAGAQHKRVYQACIPCRRRKVRCDLGSVDNPHDPPCVRCRRESKECFFSATRRKRKTEDDGSDLEEYVIRNGRRKLQAGGTDSPRHPSDRRFDGSMTPGSSNWRSQPLRRPDGSARKRHNEFGEGDATQTLENLEAQSVMRQQIPVAHQRHDSIASANGAAASAATDAQNTPQVIPKSVPHGEQAIDPGLAPLAANNYNAGHAEALKAWSRFRFVRAGWFTAQEAIDYIDYYYKFLSPLTPISPPTFSSPASHITLLTEEPILTVTLLTISSRYRQIPGAGGHCRSHAIPEQLWTYLRGMIERCLWGQEAFGGGFCGSGGSAATAMLSEEANGSSTAPWRGLRKGSLRTLGTIESLLILTEWHPRALHFPPAEATDELVIPLAESSPLMATEDEMSNNVGTALGGKRIDSWLEPAWRSDRMCWMLLSTAMGLGYELGVFDDVDELLKDDAITRPEYADEGYRTRANRIRRLLLIYTSQLAGRLGWTSMAPEHLRKTDPAVSKRRPTTTDGNTPATISSAANNFNYVPDLELDDQVIHCWAGISNVMHIGNEKLFKSRKHTTDIIQSGRYVTLLAEFTPLLRDWYREFELFPLPQYMRHILTIEYQYVRIYVNSLSLQAVVERCTNHPNGQPTTTTLSPQTLINYGKLPLGQLGGFTVQDQEYVREVVEGSRCLLRTVVEGLLPSGYLKHAPVRTYFRIISGAMFLLKTFALGAPRSDVRISIELMDATVEALRYCVVDDVHLGIRFADLLETLTSRLRNRFIQAPTAAAASGGTSTPSGVDGTAAVPVDGAWVGGHAQRLRDGLNGQAGDATVEGTISATPFDLSTGTFPYNVAPSLPPSTPAAMENGHPGGMDVTLFEEWNNPGNEMWYLPAGPAFFQNAENHNVSMTAEGVNVGGLDLLEYMAMDPVQFPPSNAGDEPSGAPSAPASATGAAPSNTTTAL
ncbi:Putative Fungal Zn binuclear cluster domain containing protein [[Torrubiella] hemipterigena]|uniref:Putative Fungal Zn binuclear cluster domain containing protein n=1 Tax=[Torrubiella] hemipterigena TaxID=1531966 RepID=A0A0A1TLZ3_9HYPO|nr:Putative Fungal Zn binuclear cluster domain containing protein [[Torrubiella] hemipterigena]